MSREPGQPAESLHAIAASAAQAASKAKEAPAASALAAAGRLLFGAVCAESPLRRVAPPPMTSPLVCEAARPLEELGLAAANAAVTEGDALRAIAALDLAESAPAAKTPAKVAEVVQRLGSLAPVVDASQIRAIGAVPRVGTEGASWGALRFEPSGQLLVRTLAGVVRVDPVHGDEAEASGVLAWDAKVMSPDNKLRFDGVVDPCRGEVLEASLVRAGDSDARGGDAESVPLPIALPLTACSPASPTRVPTVPVAWGPLGLELVARGEPVSIPAGTRKASPLYQLLGQPVTPGAPLSPNGETLVVPTSEGLVVRGKRTRILRAKELEHGYGELRDCAVSDDGARVACVRGGIAFVGVWPP
jgi:hypothetical protein